MIRRPALLAAAALALAAPACLGGGREGSSSEFNAARVVGAVTVQAAGVDPRALREGDRVPAGATLRTGSDAGLRLEGGGRAIELAADTQATLGRAWQIALEGGRALAESPGTRAISFDSRGISVRLTGGAARIERVLGTLRVGVYSGAARIGVLGRGIDVPALREMIFAGGGVPIERDPQPLNLKASDSWDRRLLGDVLELNRELDQFGRGFNSEFAGQASSPDFFGAFVSVSNLRFVDPYLPRFDPADTLIGLVFALRLAQREGNLGSVARLFAEMLAQRDQGASWGLIAKERGLTLPPLLRAVLDAIRRGTTPASGGTGGGGGGGGTPGPTPSRRPTSSPKPSPSTSPSPSPSPSPTSCSLLDRLLGNCPPAGGSDASGGAGDGGTGCSVLGILLDPHC